MNIDSIKAGVVIDHITAGNAMRIYKLLGFDKLECSVAIIKNVSSKKMGKKDIIKVDSDIPLNLEALGYIDPGVTIDVIREGKLVEKRNVAVNLDDVFFAHLFAAYILDNCNTALKLIKT